MKKLLRFIPALALAAALLTVTALACSPDDNNPEHHENVIQTDEKKPTCLQGGYYELKCTVCGWSRVFSIGDIVPHEFGPWEIVKEPTCTKAGEKRAYCSTCNKWYQSSCRQRATAGISTIQRAYLHHGRRILHLLPELPCEPGALHRTCHGSLLGRLEASIRYMHHAGIYRIYLRRLRRGWGTTTTPAKGHSFGAWFTTTQATCMEEGMQKRECATCGATESRGIPKTGHKFGAWFTTTQATCMEEGMQKRECAACGVTESRAIPKTEHAWNRRDDRPGADDGAGGR